MQPNLSLVEILAICDEAPPQENWYRVGDDVTMIRIAAPGKFLVSSGMGKPSPKPAEFSCDYSISSKEISSAQFKKLMPDYELSEPVLESSDPNQSRKGEQPVSDVDWHAAARFCNLLSKKAGLPESQWCYEIDEDYDPTLKPRSGQKLGRKLGSDY